MNLILFYSFNYTLKAKKQEWILRDTVQSLFIHKEFETRENLPKFKAIHQGRRDFSADPTSLTLSSVNSTIKLPVEYHQQTFNLV